MKQVGHNSGVVFGAAALIAASGLARAGEEYLTTGNQQKFTVIGLPDTQNYSEFYPETFKAQTKWIVEQRRALDIKFMTHFGDVVNHGPSQQEWANAREAMATIEKANIPHHITAGNHDVTPAGSPGTTFDTTNYLANFGPQRYVGKSWYKGASPSGLSSYQVFEGAGRSYLAMSLGIETPLEELQWAQGVLAKHRDMPAMLTTHRYLQDAEDYTGGVPLVSSGRYPDIWYDFEGHYNPTGINAEALWQDFIRKQSNVFLVNCGHFHEEYRQSSTNLFGNTVHEVLADYQDDPNGGNGFLRIMQFDPKNKRIDVKSYSPTLNTFETKDESQFSLAFDYDKFAKKNQVRSFQQGVNGYAGTKDTWISEEAKNSSYGNNDIFTVDDDVNNSIFSDRQGQGLVRFDGVIGSGADQVPQGSQIVSAVLSLTLADDVDSPFYSPVFYVYMMTRAWDENSTWNSLSGGLTSGSDYGILLGSFPGDNNPDSDYLRRINVTAAAQQWANGVANYGFAIIPQLISGNDDGIDICSSEAGNFLYRPWLEIEFTTGLIPAPHAIAIIGIGAVVCGRRRRPV